MHRVSAPPRVVLLGPADLTVTATLAALRASGLDAERLPATDPGLVRRRLTGGAGVLVLDVDTWNAAEITRSATTSGWTVVVLGGDAHRERVADTVAAGAAAHVPKSAPFARLLDAVRDGRLMPEAERAEWLALHSSTQVVVSDQMQRLDQLSSREREVLRHLVEGRRAAEIGATLFLSITTVRTHIRSILVKLNVNSQAQAVEVYQETARLWPRYPPIPKRYA